MRYIDLRRISIDQSWLDEASAIKEEILAVKDDIDQVRALIDKHSAHWGDNRVKSAMQALSHNKCWYSETSLAGSDADVDHYRPKKRVKECKSHKGYWWLAFEATNYRLSCTFSNRYRTDPLNGIVGGKGDHFQLYNESVRVMDETGDLCDEDPLLLDPCNIRDVTLLEYGGNGEVLSSYSESESKIDFKRAEYSIRVYNLNHSQFKEARQKIWRELESLLQQFDIAHKRFVREGGKIEKKSELDGLVRQIRDHYAENKPFSSYMKSMVQQACAGKSYERELTGAA